MPLAGTIGSLLCVCTIAHCHAADDVLAGYAVVARALSLAVEFVPIAYKLFLTETLIEQLH